MEPQRKQGVCLTSSPVSSNVVHQRSFQDRLRPISASLRSTDPASSSPTSSSSLPRMQSTRNHQAGELVTFKSLGGNSNSQRMSAENKVDAMAQQQQQQHQQDNSSSCCVCCPSVPGEQKKIPATSSNLPQKPGDIFQTVPLDDAPQPHRILPRIEPINPYRKPIDLSNSSSNNNASPASARGLKLAPPFKFAAYLGTILSAFLFSLGVFFVKLLPIENVLQEKAKIVTFRGFSFTILCGITILFQQSTFVVQRDEIMINVIRSLFGVFGAFGLYVAVQYITVAEAVSLTYLSPVWTCLLGYFILGEKLPITLLIGFPLGGLGLILIAHPDLILNVQDEVVSEIQRHHHHIVVPPNYTLHHLNYTLEVASSTSSSASSSSSDLPLPLIGADIYNSTTFNGTQLPFELIDPEDTTKIYLEQRWPGVLVSMATSVIIAIVHITLKFRKTTPIQTTTFYLGVASLIFSVIIQCIIGFGKWPSTWLEWSLHAAIGFCSFLGQALLQWALQYEAAGVLSVVRSVDIIFSFIWSSVFLGEDVLWTSVLGALAICVVIALIMFNDSIQQSLSKVCCKKR